MTTTRWPADLGFVVVLGLFAVSSLIVISGIFVTLFMPMISGAFWVVSFTGLVGLLRLGLGWMEHRPQSGESLL